VTLLSILYKKKETMTESNNYIFSWLFLNYIILRSAQYKMILQHSGYIQNQLFIAYHFILTAYFDSFHRVFLLWLHKTRSILFFVLNSTNYLTEALQNVKRIIDFKILWKRVIENNIFAKDEMDDACKYEL
jgi:hypothetical protein